MKTSPLQELADFLEYYQDSLVLTPSFDVFMDSINVHKKLIEQKISKDFENQYLCMIYAGTIGTLEAYLSDTFIKLVIDTEKIKEKALQNEKIFGKKYLLSEISNDKFDVNSEIVSVLSGVMWHNLDKVRNIYADVGIQFPQITKELRVGVQNRHDIVHRSGKNMKGINISLSPEDVTNLIQEIENLVYVVNKNVVEARKSFNA